MIPANVFANNILRRSFRQGVPVTLMKLQRLLYFIYRDYLQQTGRILFPERFEVWKYGPVISSVYHEFRRYGSRPITDYSKDSAGDAYVVVEDDFLRSVIDYNWEKFKGMNGIELSRLHYFDESAWAKAFNKKRLFLDDEDIRKDDTGKNFNE